jgi:glutathione S-transferase
MSQIAKEPRASSTSAIPPESLLIGFPICPFVARARIVAQEKGVELKVRYIDLANKPAWFLDRSPTGTVPALDTGEHFIFESSVISEFINESVGPSLHPDSPLDRAVNRAWADYAANLLRSQYMLLTCDSNTALEHYRITLADLMRKLERAPIRRPFFNGESFAIVDAAYAPLFVRYAFLKEHLGLDLLLNLPTMREWGAKLIDRTSVRHIHGAGHYADLEKHMRQQGAVLLRSRATQA